MTALFPHRANGYGLRLVALLIHLQVICLVSSCRNDTLPRYHYQGKNIHHRIISLTPSITEILFALEAGDSVIAVSDADTFPPQVKRLPRIGSLKPNYEMILYLKPDLVLGDTEMNGYQLTRIQALGIPTQSLTVQTLADLFSSITIAGQLTGHQEQAKTLNATLRKKLQMLKKLANRLPYHPTVYLEIWPSPLMTAGSNTYMNDLIILAGGINAFGDLTGYSPLSEEQLFFRDPDVILLTSSEPNQIKARPGWQNLTAVKYGRVFKLNPDLVSRPSPRIEQGARQIYQALYKATYSPNRSKKPFRKP